MVSRIGFFTIIRVANLLKIHIFIAVLYSFLNKLSDIVPEILIGMAIDIIVNKEQSIIGRFGGISDPVQQLYCVAIATITLWFFESLFEYFYSVAWYNLAQTMQQNVRITLYDKIQRADMQFIESKTLGDLLSVIDNDVDCLEVFLARGCNDIVQLVTNTIVMGALFFLISPTIALFSIIPVPVVAIISYFFRRKIAIMHALINQASTELKAYIASRLRGLLTIKSYTTEYFERLQLEKRSMVYKAIAIRGNKISSSYIPTVRMAVLFGFVVSLVLGGRAALIGSMSISWFAAFVFLTQRFLWPFAGLASIIEQYEKFCSAANRVWQVYTLKNNIKDGDQVLPINTHGAISLQNVSFAYTKDSTSVLKNISILIPVGKTVALVGASGSGKSTITKLLLRLYDVTSGSIHFAGTDITEYRIQDLRKSIAFVSQEPYIINGSIKENICYGSEDASIDNVITAAKTAILHDFIMQLPHGYDTILSEQGSNLSGGQKQRIAIARAVLKNAPIMIFDEATSALDNETELAFKLSIKQLAYKHSIIIIAHRLLTVQDADLIFVLDRGSIIESGNHKDLLLHSGMYKRLWNVQQGKSCV